MNPTKNFLVDKPQDINCRKNNNSISFRISIDGIKPFHISDLHTFFPTLTLKTQKRCVHLITHIMSEGKTSLITNTKRIENQFWH